MSYTPMRHNGAVDGVTDAPGYWDEDPPEGNSLEDARHAAVMDWNRSCLCICCDADTWLRNGRACRNVRTVA